MAESADKIWQLNDERLRDAMILILYSTPDCHLCEQATALLAGCAARRPGVTIREVDVVGDAALLARYGERVPVLYDPIAQRELGWPFDADTALAFVDTAARAGVGPGST